MGVSDLRLGLLLGLLLSAAILATNVIWPSLAGHQVPDNGFSVSLGWLAIIGLIGFAGFLRVRATSRLREAAIAGATISFIAIGMAMVTFFAIDNLFFGIVSQQPEKIWLFQHSGYSNMQSYLNHSILSAFWTVLPVITALGAICGIVGAIIGRSIQRRTH
jgi:hypothetical protein